MARLRAVLSRGCIFAAIVVACEAAVIAVAVQASKLSKFKLFESDSELSSAVTVTTVTVDTEPRDMRNKFIIDSDRDEVQVTRVDSTAV